MHAAVYAKAATAGLDDKARAGDGLCGTKKLYAHMVSFKELQGAVLAGWRVGGGAPGTFWRKPSAKTTKEGRKSKMQPVHALVSNLESQSLHRGRK